MRKLILYVLAVSVCFTACSCRDESYEETPNIHHTTEYPLPTYTGAVIDPAIVSEYKYTLSCYQSDLETNSLKHMVLSVPVQVEDYISEDGQTFEIRKLASDYGWQEQDGYFYYDCGDMWIYIDLNNDMVSYQETPQKLYFSWCRYMFTQPNRPEELYVPYDYYHGTKMNNADVAFVGFKTEADYKMNITSELWASMDELVILTYMFTFPNIQTNHSPFEFDTFISQHGDCPVYPENLKVTCEYQFNFDWEPN